MRYLCITCEGEYTDICLDGLNYYHACPAITLENGEQKERKDKRDENIGKKKEGKGRTIV